jgi:hypothetical protein
MAAMNSCSTGVAALTGGDKAGDKAGDKFDDAVAGDSVESARGMQQHAASKRNAVLRRKSMRRF